MDALINIEQALDLTFSEEQRAVVRAYGQPVSIIACAGAGKTTTLIAKLLYLELAHGVKPYEMLAISYTKKAVDDIEERYKHVLQKYITFFRAKSRTNKFYDLEVDIYNEELIEIAIMSVLTNVNLANFEEVVRRVITSGELKDNDYLNEFQKYDIEEAFWKHFRHTFAGFFV